MCIKRPLILSCFFFLIPLFFLSAGGKQDAGGTGSGITLTTARATDASVMLDPGDPEKRSFQENRWNNAYQKELGIKLEYKWISPDSASNTVRWSTAIASGDLPDFAAPGDNIYKLLLEADLIADMKEIFAQNVSEDIRSMLTDYEYQQMTFDGKLLGFPLPNKALNGGSVLFIRKDWLDALKLPVPK
ncbi:MAG: extracellular solute-binding protein, partial [Hungatella sp.]|nr:extracellular solute-binding protein [Hungatella sp.]